MCDDCQAYAHHLDQAPRILDANGGTDVYQTTPSRIAFHTGHEHVRCVRLSPKGLMRWYAGCCATPIANTLASPGFPFAGLVHTIVDHAGDGRSRDEALGPPRARTQARFGHQPLPPDSHARAPVGLIARSVKSLLGAWIKREHKPSPFFDGQTGAPVVTPTVVSSDVRAALLKRARRPPHDA